MPRRLERPPFEATFVDDLPATVVEAWFGTLPGWFALGAGAAPLSKANVVRVDSPVGAVAVKRERIAGARRILRTLGLAPTRSRRAFVLGHALLGAGVDTPRPLAWISRRGPGIARAAWLVTEYVEAPSLGELLTGIDGGRRRSCLGAVAEAVARLHGRGFRHRDLKAPNILVCAEEPRIRFVDLDGVSARSPTRAGRVRDLGRLCVSLSCDEARAAGVGAADWRLFVRHYVERARTFGPEGLERRTIAWAERHMARSRRRRRPIA